MTGAAGVAGTLCCTASLPRNKRRTMAVVAGEALHLELPGGCTPPLTRRPTWKGTRGARRWRFAYALPLSLTDACDGAWKQRCRSHPRGHHGGHPTPGPPPPRGAGWPCSAQRPAGGTDKRIILGGDGAASSPACSPWLPPSAPPPPHASLPPPPPGAAPRRSSACHCRQRSRQRLPLHNAPAAAKPHQALAPSGVEGGG